MAISVADWSSTTDPFILALSHSWASASASSSASSSRYSLIDSNGFINGIFDDKDIQEIFWVKDAGSPSSFNATAVETEIFSYLNYLNEWPLIEENVTGGFIPWVTHDIIQQDPKQCDIVIYGKTAGTTKYSLYAFSAYAWVEKDPAQILFSWAAHHAPSTVALKDYLDQASFQDASDYYDENPIDLVLIREVGISIADQIKKVMENTSDFLAIRPASSGGAVQLAVITRRNLTDRTTAIDLDSESVSGFTIRPTDMFTLDEIVCNFGNSILQTVVPLQASHLNATQPVNYVGDSVNTVKMKVGSIDEFRSVTIEARYTTKKANVLNHIDIGFWKDDQDELEVEFTDWTHFNFEVGDKVHFTGRDFDGTGDFICTEKTLDLDSLKASGRFIQLHGLAGKQPRYADRSNLLLSLRQNSLGDNDDGTTTFPSDILALNSPRSIDRWWDESGFYFQGLQHSRGTPPGLPRLELDTRNRWPGIATTTLQGLEFIDDNNSGFNKLWTPSVSNFTFYWVGEITGTYTSSRGYLLDCSGANDLIFSISGNGSGGGTYNKYQFYDGAWRGSVTLAPGWQILVYVLDTTGAKIRRNGVDIETGLSYSAVQIDNAGDFGIMCAASGTIGDVHGHHMEFNLFRSAHSAATIEAIEAHLAEKYNITI